MKVAHSRKIKHRKRQSREKVSATDSCHVKMKERSKSKLKLGKKKKA